MDPNVPELLAAIRGGDEAAVWELYLQYRSRIEAACRHKLGDDPDLVAEAAAGVLDRIRKYARRLDQPERFENWLFGKTTRHACADVWRRHGHDVGVLFSGKEPPEVAPEPVEPEQAGPFAIAGSPVQRLALALTIVPPWELHAVLDAGDWRHLGELRGESPSQAIDTVVAELAPAYEAREQRALQRLERLRQGVAAGFSAQLDKERRLDELRGNTSERAAEERADLERSIAKLERVRRNKQHEINRAERGIRLPSALVAQFLYPEEWRDESRRKTLEDRVNSYARRARDRTRQSHGTG